MAISATYYLNGPTLGSSTTIYSNSSLTIVAADGFYSDGVTSREQVSGVLLPAVTCGTCGVPCGSSISGSGGTGIYLLNLDAGNTSSDVGAIIIRFDPYNTPDGIRATYNGNIYNSLTSSVDGFHQTSNAGNFTVIGLASSDCGLAGNTTNLPTITEYLYNGSSFASTGNTQNITIYPGDVSLSSASSPGNCMMVIPKTTATPSLINFEFIGPCSGTAWNVDVQCPDLLTGFSSSVVALTSEAACLLDETVIYYNASLAGTPGIVGLYDFVFSDAYGASPLAQGFYHAREVISGSNDWFEVDENGVVIAVGNCAGCTPTISVLGTTGNSPNSITIDSSENVYTTNLSDSNVTKITPSGVSTTLGSTGSGPVSITVDSSGNIYTANYDVNNVTKITPSGVSTIFGTTGTAPQDITIDSSGNVYTANSVSNNVTKITPSGVSTILGTTGSSPVSITVDSSGNVYTANSASNNVTKITPLGVSTILGTTGSFPMSITIDSSGNIYTINEISNNITKITPSGVSTVFATVDSGPAKITIDSSNNLYATYANSNNVIKITPSGASTILGTVGSSPVGIVVNNSSGNIYTSNYYDNNVSKITQCP